MGLVRGQIEKRLSAMLGLNVSFDKFNFSLLGGSVEAQGVTITGPDPSAPPLLTIRRVRAEISLGAALKKEFVIKSLTIEKPVVTMTRGADGRINLPSKPGSATTSETSTDEASGDGDSWKLDAQKVLVVDAEVHYHEANGYRASIDGLLAELKQTAGGGGFEFTLFASAAGRRDVNVPVGPLKLNGIANNMPSLLQWQQARIAGSFELGDLLRGKFDIPSLKPFDVNTELQGSFNLDKIRKLLPSGKQ